MFGDGIVTWATGERDPAGSKGGRPAELYRAGTAWSTGSPIKRSRKNRRQIR